MRINHNATTISIIVPVYNVEPYLCRCVDSILNQTYHKFQLVLVDDGSPDNSGKICDRYKEMDSRVVVIHKENGGLSSARNSGLDWVKSQSLCEWITFIDSDDWVHPDYLNILLNSVLQSKTRASVCKYQLTNGIEQPLESDFSLDIIEADTFYVENNVLATVAWGKLYHSTCFENLRFPIGRIHEDEYTTHIALGTAKIITYADVSLYYYYQNTNGIMRSKWNEKRLDAIAAYKNQIQYFTDNHSEKAYLYAVNKLIEYLYQTLVRLKDNDNYKNARRLVKKELRSALKEYYRVYNIKEHKWVFAEAYPMIHRILLRIPWIDY